MAQKPAICCQGCTLRKDNYIDTFGIHKILMRCVQLLNENS